MVTSKSKALERANAIEASVRTEDGRGPYFRFDHNTLPQYKKALKEAYGALDMNKEMNAGGENIRQGIMKMSDQIRQGMKTAKKIITNN